MLEYELAVMLTAQVAHQRYLSQDGYGTPTFAAPVMLPALVEYKIRRIVTAQGEERMSRAKVFLDGNVVLDLRDKLTLEDGTSPALQLVYQVRDEGGAVHHIECYF